MNILKKPLNNLKPRKVYYYGKCSNPKCKGEYSFKEDEIRCDLVITYSYCPNCRKTIEVFTKKKYAGIK